MKAHEHLHAYGHYTPTDIKTQPMPINTQPMTIKKEHSQSDGHIIPATKRR
jgi:hypothetical protein